MFDLSRLPIAPAGLGNCRHCTYLNNDNAALCYACAVQTMEALAPEEIRCWICDRPRPEGQKECSNAVCRMNEDERGFRWNFAIAMKSGVLERGLWGYKYDGKWGWRLIFSRLLVGFMDQQSGLFESFDLVIPSPTYVGPEEGARTSDHIAPIVRSAGELSTTWPYRATPPVIRRTKHIPSMTSAASFGERRWIAEHDLRSSLDVVDVGTVRGKRIIVFDDTFTTGLTLREVALALRHAGASEVCGITLMRQPWR